MGVMFVCSLDSEHPRDVGQIVFKGACEERLDLCFGEDHRGLLLGGFRGVRGLHSRYPLHPLYTGFNPESSMNLS